MLSLLATLALVPVSVPETVITILHTNDMHAHLEATGKFGGYARQATLIKRFRGSDPNPILLNAGDTFQGTLYFNTYQGLADLAFMNAVRYDAMCLGNHEFDGGPATLAQFIKLANFPVLCANLDFSSEPLLKEIVRPTAILSVGGTRVGIVGAVTPDMPNISNPGPNIRVLDQDSALQNHVDSLTRAGVDKVILLTHIGYEEDQRLARKLRNVDVIVGGHSHSPLGTPALPGWPKPAGPYPTVIKGSQGHNVYVVQAYDWSRVLGRLKVHFDKAGRVVRVSEAKPVVVDEKVPEDAAIKSMMAAFKMPLIEQAEQPVGVAAEEISRSGENPMANLIADAILEAAEQYKPDVAFINLGGVRAGIDRGPITYGEAITVLPFANVVTILKLTGAELKLALEQGYPDGDKIGGRLYPSRGSSYRVDGARAVGSRVSDVVINGKPLELGATYTVAINNFSAAGGDSLFALRDAKGNRFETDLIDVQVLSAYLKKHSPVVAPREERVIRGSRG